VEVGGGHEACLIPNRHAQREAQAHRPELLRDAEQFSLGLEDDRNLSRVKIIVGALSGGGSGRDACSIVLGARPRMGRVAGNSCGRAWYGDERPDRTPPHWPATANPLLKTAAVEPSHRLVS
jgi:hypothetical protein